MAESLPSEPLGELLRAASRELAVAFGDVPVPPALQLVVGPFGGAVTLESGSYDLGGADTRTVVLAGPGVLGHVSSLRAFAGRANVAVANTWGAKGVLSWDDPHHMGTCGLQQDDFELLGFADHDLVVATGIDPDESPTERFALAPVVEIAPSDLAAQRGHVVPRTNPIRPNALYERLAAVAQPGYVDDRFPRHPARAVMDLKHVLTPGGVVTAEPGLAGLWVARTFPTDQPGTVVVPARRVEGIGAACALAVALRDRPAAAVTTAPVDPVTAAITELATGRGLAFDLVVWDDTVDLALTDLLIAAAGPVVAWDGLDL